MYCSSFASLSTRLHSYLLSSLLPFFSSCFHLSVLSFELFFLDYFSIHFIIYSYSIISLVYLSIFASYPPVSSLSSLLPFFSLNPLSPLLPLFSLCLLSLLPLFFSLNLLTPLLPFSSLYLSSPSSLSLLVLLSHATPR